MYEEYNYKLYKLKEFPYNLAEALAYYNRGRIQESLAAYRKAVALAPEKTEQLSEKEAIALLKEITEQLSEKEATALLKELTEELSEAERQPFGRSLVVEKAMQDVLLDLGFSQVITNADQTFTIARTGQKVIIEGPARLVGEQVKALAIDETTRLTAPTSAVSLSQGSLSVRARLTDPSKKYSDLVRMNHNNDLYIYHQGEGGRFVIFYNGVRLGETSLAVTDNEWHHYVFTWQDSKQKFYIDGLRSLSADVSESTADTEVFAIGWLGDRDGEQWGGLLANLITFNRSLRWGEVVALYNATLSEGS